MNVVLITIDAWRHDALAAAPDHRGLARYNLAGRLHTPNLDHFAREHVHFTQALSVSPSTTPSLASVMTGLYPPAHGVRAFFEQRLLSSVRTLAEVLREHGYATVTLHEAKDPTSEGIPILSDRGVDALRGFDEIVHNDQELINSQAVRSGRPVLAFLHLWDVHAPYLYSYCVDIPNRLEPLRRKLADMGERFGVPIALEDDMAIASAVKRLEQAVTDPATYVREFFGWYIEGVNWFDRYRWPMLVQTLQAAGLWDGTLLFVFADHGEGPLEDMPHAGKHFGHGAVLLDDRLRVPLIVCGLPGVEPGQVHRQVSLVDLAPTVLDVLGIDPSIFHGQGDPMLRGFSLLPVTRGETRPNPWHFAEVYYGQPKTGRQVLYQRAVRTARYKLFCHDGEISMRRFQRWDNVLGKYARRALGKVNPAWRNPAIDERKLVPNKLFWIDLEADPHEQSPKRWSYSVPPEVREMRGVLARLYRTPVYGPPIDPGDEEALIARRLASLGYIDQPE